MRIHAGRKRRTADAVRLARLTLVVCLLGLAGPIQIAGQNAVPQSHVVAVKSDPPGAMIWKKEGRDYTCTNILTPGAVELAFRDDSDVQRLRLRRFGYSAKNLDVKPTDQEVRAVLLGKPVSESFLLTSDAPPDIEQLNEPLKKEFENTILADPEAFRCAPFDLYFIHLGKDKEEGDAELSVVLWLDRSFGGQAFRLASHAATTQERHEKMGQVALENGMGEVIGRFHRLAANFPDLKVISVSGIYSTTDAVLDHERTQALVTRMITGQVLGPGGGYHPGLVSVTAQVTIENDVVKDQAAQRGITFNMPAARIPDTLDKKAISDAVLATGKIILFELTE